MYTFTIRRIEIGIHRFAAGRNKGVNILEQTASAEKQIKY